VNDVAVVEWRVLPAEEAGVVLIDKKREVRTQFAVFVAKALGERRMGHHEAIQRIPHRGRVDRHITSATREATVDAVQQHPHARTTFDRCVFRHPPHGTPG